MHDVNSKHQFTNPWSAQRSFVALGQIQGAEHVYDLFMVVPAADTAELSDVRIGARFGNGLDDVHYTTLDRCTSPSYQLPSLRTAAKRAIKHLFSNRKK